MAAILSGIEYTFWIGAADPLLEIEYHFEKGVAILSYKFENSFKNGPANSLIEI